jgi:hypothetical protein
MFFARFEVPTDGYGCLGTVLAASPQHTEQRTRPALSTRRKRPRCRAGQTRKPLNAPPLLN